MSDFRVRCHTSRVRIDDVTHLDPALPLDFEACYRAASGRDARWDGRVYLGVTSTGIYCRPSCPARKPKRENCRFFATAAACVAAGFRACKRCRPDAVPGTRDWDARSDLVGRAVRGIRDGVVDSVGVSGLAQQLAVSERHLRRIVLESVGVGPVQLARTRRAHAARALIEQTALPLADVAFAAGFGSVRQFGDTMREEFGVPPSALPRRATSAAARVGDDAAGAPDPVSDERPRLAIRLRTRTPFDAGATRAFLVAHAIPGRDSVGSSETSHAIDVPGGTAAVRIRWSDVPSVASQAGKNSIDVPVLLTLPSLADTMPAIQLVRRMLDLDADPAQITAAFAGDARLAHLVRRRPGLRLPGARDPHEFALATVLGQQVSLAAARTLQGRLVAAYSRDVQSPAGDGEFLPRVDVARVAAHTAAEVREQLRITGARAATVQALAAALAAGLDVGPGADRERARAELRAIRGIGPWTVELVAMRALGDPDAYPSGDLILRRALGVDSDREALRLAESWRPFRGYATQHLWADFLAEAARKEDA